MEGSLDGYPSCAAHHRVRLAAVSIVSDPIPLVAMEFWVRRIKGVKKYFANTPRTQSRPIEEVAKNLLKKYRHTRSTGAIDVYGLSEQLDHWGTWKNQNDEIIVDDKHRQTSGKTISERRLIDFGRLFDAACIPDVFENLETS